MMTIRHRQRFKGQARGRRSGFTLPEALIALGLLGTTVIALLAGLSTGFTVIRFARENLRATQIMLEKVETIRLYSWDQVIQTSPTPFIPTSFTAAYDPNATNDCKGPVYFGSLTITPIDAGTLAASYTNSMRKITVQLTWQTGTFTRNRQFTSYISRYGLQEYIY